MERKKILQYLAIFTLVITLISTTIILVHLIKRKQASQIEPQVETPEESKKIKTIEDYEFKIVNKKDLCIKKILENDIDVSEYIESGEEFTINFNDGLCDIESIEAENDFLETIKVENILFENTNGIIIYQKSAPLEISWETIFLRLEKDNEVLLLRLDSLFEKESLSRSDDSRYLLLEGGERIMIDLANLKTEILDMSDHYNPNTTIVGPGGSFDNYNLVFAFVDADNHQMKGAKYVIYNIPNKTITEITEEQYPDFRWCPTACLFRIYSYGSLGFVNEEIFFYTTFNEYDHADPTSLSKYGIKFIDINSSATLYEDILVEYSYPEEDLRHLEHYLCELEINTDSLSWENNTPTFKYRFKYPIKEGSSTEWTEWKEY